MLKLKEENYKLSAELAKDLIDVLENYEVNENIEVLSKLREETGLE